MVADGYKVKLLTVLAIFEQETDKEHPLSADAIAQKVKVKSGINASRKGIYDDMNALNDFWELTNNPRRIEKDEKGKGYYLANRPFSPEDVKLMVDSIEASKYLSEKKTMELINALETLCSNAQTKDMKSQLVVLDRVKNMNTEIHKSLGVISSAIANNRQIRFKYFDYDINKRRVYRKRGGYYQISPYELVYTDDNYYLMGFEKQRRTYRIDRMANVEVIPEPREGSETFADLRKDKLRLQKSTFSMFDGRIETVTMVFRKNLMNAVMDRFGSGVFVSPVDKEHFQISVPVAVSQQFYGWIFGLGNYVKITNPPEIKMEMAAKLEEIRKRYD